MIATQNYNAHSYIHMTSWLANLKDEVFISTSKILVLKSFRPYGTYNDSLNCSVFTSNYLLINTQVHN